MWRTEWEWFCVGLLLASLYYVGVVGEEGNDLEKELLGSFPQDPNDDDLNYHHKIRHHRHRHQHRRKRINHADPTPDSLDLSELPLYPKNVSEETLDALRRHKRQYYNSQSYESSSSPSQRTLYVLEDGSDWREDGSEWSAPSPCSRPCGGGVAVEEKICRDPFGCSGETRRYFSCNTQPCPGGEVDFRAEQCAAFNNVPFEGRYYKWIPYTKAPNKCELNCMPQGERFYYRHKRQVIDGTHCDEEHGQICVAGKCFPVGCDNVLGSRAREDNCRQCGGDGRGCHTVKGVFDSNENLQVGYNDVLLIPQGATNIQVKEKKICNNYLAIRNTSNHYYLNGNWRIDFPRELSFAGTLFHYERKPHSFFAPETIRALGPTTEPLYIVVLYQETNPGIEYEYSISDKENQIALTTPGTYTWIYDEFTPCSSSCGGGLQQRSVYCARRTEESIEYVEEYLCDGGRRPQSQQYCNEQPCPLRWYTGEWGGCSAKCGSNETGIQYRNVFCEQSIQGSSAVVDDERRCEAEVGRAPEKVQSCTGEVAGGICASWFVSEWSACSALCGDGEEKRTVKCHAKQDNATNVYDDSHCSEQKLEEIRPCYLKPCEGVDWISGPWSGCKASADPCDDSLNPVETRQVYCASSKGQVYGDEFCHEYRKPNATRECESSTTEASGSTVSPTCKYAWFAMQWGECLLTSCTPSDNTTGQIKGTKSRLVFCGTLSASTGMVNMVEDEEKCNASKKYDPTEPCDLDEDYIKTECFEKAAWFTGPWSKCSKNCGAGSRSRAVICMVGNEATTDVKKCGEEGIVFTSEDCVGEDCTTASTGDEMISVTPKGMGSTGKPAEIGLQPGIDCEPDYEDDYYYYYDLEGSGVTTEMPTSTTEEESGTTMSSTTDDDMDMSGSGDEDQLLISGDDLISSGESGMDELIPTEMGTTDEADDEMIIGKSTTGTDELLETSSSSSELSSLSTSETSEDGETTTEGGEKETTTEGKDDEEEETTTTEEGTTEEGTTEETTTTEASEEEDAEAGEEEVDEEAQSDDPNAAAAEYDAIEGPPAKLEEGVTEEMDEMSGSGSGDEEDEIMMTTETTSSAETEEPDEELVASDDESSGLGSSGSGSGDEMMEEMEIKLEPESLAMDDGSGSGSGDEMESTSSAPRTTLEQALTAETKLPKCPPRTKPTEEPPLDCSTTTYGCCPNGEDVATGPFGAGCEIPKSCAETKFGCCDDGLTPAQGKLKLRGCPMPNCTMSLYGCCPDGKTPAEGNDLLGCQKHCEETEFGCCLDGKTPKKGPKGKGCPKVKCEDTKFGCCPGEDKEIATGPNYEGCKEINTKNCSASFFKCCLDGKTAALGENEEGCPEVPPCVKEEFGCCDDEVTSAHGPNKEGCCLNTEFGCCDDNIQAATGPGLAGCTCKNSLFGCCNDNVTAARGPDGDCGCKFTEHNCCPDGYTAANGSNYEGCPCSTFQLGCCPDGVTVAKGPNKEGCGCEFSEFGCCPDRKSPKESAEDGCGCANSWYGCCPDGVTEAKGEEFEGCEEIPIKPGDVCGLDKERGSCRNFTVKWFFDMEYGGCSRFWWGGCDGNLNRFGSQDECKAVCVEPEGRDACYLPQVSGPCEGYYPSWYYDPQREMCLQFVYGGCLGNNNRFATRELCENNCLMSDRVDACDQPRTEGPCKGNYTRFYFDKEDQSCKEYQYGGCKGNHNNFLTDRECEQRCSQEGRIRAILDQCIQVPSQQESLKDPHCGGADLIRWYYDVVAETCLKFTYGGCGNANSNMFVSRAECLSVCANSSSSFPPQYNFKINVPALKNISKSRESCFLPRQEGPCGEKLARWYYDTHEQRCVPFYYGGCQGNANRFTTLGDCEKSCPAALLADNTCLQPAAVGDCASYSERYYFDPYESRCKGFVYSGCGGNSNNFIQIDDCRNKCERSYVRQPVVSTPQEFNTAHCFQLPVDHSSCYGSDPTATLVKWFYDKGDGVCKQFRFYPDCEAHARSANRFDDRQECEDRCESAQDLCTLPQVVGPCSRAFPQFSYDVDTDTCVEFSYGGCQGNGNRFDSIVQCEQRCRKGTGHVEDPYGGRGREDDEDARRREEEERRRAEYYAELERRRQDDERRRQEEEGPTTIAPYIDQDDICSLPMEIGPCRASIPSYFYDARSRRCQAFMYGGCDGNSNRFETEEMCERQCGQFRGEDVCRISQADPGPCRARIQKWYFNPNDRSCQQFYYGGCMGNGNRFSSREECESVCHAHTEIVTANDTISGAAICRLSPDHGPCTDSFKRWHFDWEQNTCLPFVYGGCGGNLNSFGSFDACLSYCQRALQYETESHGQSQGHEEPRTEERGEGWEDENALENCSDQIAYCKSLQCPYGLQKNENDGGCPQCECHDPCRDYPCLEDEQCAVDIVGTITHGRQVTHSQSFRPVCRKQNKDGTCPNLWGGQGQRVGICSQECTTDADCMAELKCCSNGCGTSCMLPQTEAAPDSRAPYYPPPTVNRNEQPPRIMSTVTEIEAEEGGLASLECISRGNPQPQISWRFNNAEVAVDSGRFRTLQDGSVLQIIGVYKRDEGVYSCIADNGIGRPANLDITVAVTEPTAKHASIVEESTDPNVIVSLGSAASLRCFAMGWPRPTVTWWRGEKMLPFSSERYEQMRDYSLIIRLVSLRDLGPYTCQAYNGQGKAASWTVTVQTLGPVATSDASEDREYLQYVISGGRRPPVYVGGNFTGGRQRPVGPWTRPTTPSTTTERLIVPNYLVPLRTQIKMEKTLYVPGLNIVIPCEVEGYPPPSVHWYKDDSPIVTDGERISIFNENEVRIYNASTEDAGSYRCDAVNEYGSSSSQVTIQVEGIYLHPNCTDNPFFANCKLIVKANYCTNKYYAKFCCKACTMAGQLSQYGPHLREYGQEYFRRGQVEYVPTNLQSDRDSRGYQVS